MKSKQAFNIHPLAEEIDKALHDIECELISMSREDFIELFDSYGNGDISTIIEESGFIVSPEEAS